MKFNDMRVCEMDEETVLKEAVGGYELCSTTMVVIMEIRLIDMLMQVLIF